MDLTCLERDIVKTAQEMVESGEQMVETLGLTFELWNSPLSVSDAIDRAEQEDECGRILPGHIWGPVVEFWLTPKDGEKDDGRSFFVYERGQDWVATARSWRDFIRLHPMDIQLNRRTVERLDTLREILPLPSGLDKYCVLAGWLDLARDEGLLTSSEYWSARDFIAPLL